MLIPIVELGRKWGPFGRLEHANTFEWGKLGPRMGLLYFTGNAYVYDAHIYL